MITEPTNRADRLARMSRPAASAAVALVVTVVLWRVFFPTLSTPSRISSSVPCSVLSDDPTPIAMASGDHLQLLYHLGLLDDYLRGDIPWFSDLWEFNTSDAERRPRPDPCYAPAAGPFLVLRRLGASDALAWNLDHFLFLFVGTLFLAALARRLGASWAASFFAAAVAGSLPYRWAAIATGSPTGFCMGLVPAALYFTDRAVRDRSVAAGVAGGLAVLSIYATDLHCFLFTAMAVPAWGLLAPAFFPGRRTGKRETRRWLAALLPIVVAFAASGAAGLLASRRYAGTNVESGRTLEEVASHSPDWDALFRPVADAPLAGQMQVGYVLPALFLMAVAILAVSLVGAARRHDTARIRRAAGGLCLAASIVFCFLLAVGTNGPFDGLLIRAMRLLVPPFKLVRQPIKILCLLPSLAAAFTAATAAAAPTSSRRRGANGWPLPPALVQALSVIAFSALAAVAMLDARIGLNPGSCRLAEANDAYAAAAADAAARGLDARILVVPITRGDAVMCSAYLYWAGKYHLRMLNGYTSVFDSEYARAVASPFSTMVSGDLTKRQLAALSEYGVTAVLFDENVHAVRGMVPFAAGSALRRLASNPNLEFLAEDGGVWAFALRTQPASARPAAARPDVEVPRTRWAFDPPESDVRPETVSYAAAHNAGYGFLVRAEADKDLALSVIRKDRTGKRRRLSKVFAAVPGAAPGDFRLAFIPALSAKHGAKVGLVTGGARVSDVVFASESATGGLARVSFADFVHRNGEIVPDGRGIPRRLRFAPGDAPKGIVAEGPFLPLLPRPGHVRLVEYRGRSLSEKGEELPPPPLLLRLRDGTCAEVREGDILPVDGTEPVCLGVPFDSSDGLTLELDGLIFAEASAIMDSR